MQTLDVGVARESSLTTGRRSNEIEPLIPFLNTN